MSRRARNQSPNQPRPSHVGRSSAVAALAMLALVVGCGKLLPDPPPDGEAHRQPLIATASVSAMLVTLDYEPQTADFRGISAPTEGVAAAAHDDRTAGRVTVAVFREGPLSGTMLRLHWGLEDEASDPTVVSATAWRADGSVAQGAVSLGGVASEQGQEQAMTVATLSEVSVGASATAACLSADYPSAAVDSPLGDVDASGAVDMRDVVLAHAAIASTSLDTADGFALFHHDMTGDCRYDQSDVEHLLLKAALDDLAARPVLKPTRLTYRDVLDGRPALLANAGNAPLVASDLDALNLNGTPLSTDVSWVIGGQTALWTVTGGANDALGALRAETEAGEAHVPVGNLAVLIAGQSNAVGTDPAVPSELQSPTPGVYMLGNDYHWKAAVEPLDDPMGQLDCVSLDNTAGASLGTSLGQLLRDGSADIAATHRDSYLIPAGLGGSRIGPHSRPNCQSTIGWNLGPTDLAGTDRDTLFGSAAYRALVSAGERDNPVGNQDARGGPVSALIWYQGESDNSNPTLRGAYSQLTEQVFEAFKEQLGAVTAAVDPAVIYAQLAAYGCCEQDAGETPAMAEVEDLRSHDIAERQRRFEQAAYAGTAQLQPNSGLSDGIERAYMVVTHDLPRFDRIHLSAEGQTILAGRVALAYQEHVLGWDVDGTGPRIESIARSGDTVVLSLDRDVDDTSDQGPDGYSDYFTVYQEAPSSGPDYSGYGGNELIIADVRRDPDDASRVLISLANAPESGSLYLRYKRPHEATEQSDYLEDVIRGVDSGLPLPSFGPLRVP